MPWLRRPAAGLFIAACVLASLTATLAPLTGSLLPVALAYLLVTLVAAAAWGYLVGVAAALAADLLVNFFFVPPVHTFTVQKPENFAALLAFLAVALIGASMLSLLRRQAQLANARRAEAAMLLNLTQELAHSVSPRDAMYRLCSTTARSLGARGAAILQRTDRGWTIAAGAGIAALSKNDIALAAEALRTGEIARFRDDPPGRMRRGRRTDDSRLTVVPFRPATRETGVLRIAGPVHTPPLAESTTLLYAFADEAAMALQRARLAEEAHRVQALEQANELKTAILSSVSHDLRSPLTAIKAAVGTLRDRDNRWSEEDRESLLETIESQTDRLSATVNGLLEMSRLESGTVQAQLEVIDATVLLSDVREATRSATEGRSVPVEAEPGTWLRADYAFVFQALTNLIENAAKYSTPGGAINLAATKDRHVVRLSVRDEGPGIPQDDLPYIFEKFYRGSGTQRVPGSGLGLSIVKAMIKMCGGSVHADSTSAGSVFTIELPAAMAPPE